MSTVLVTGAGGQLGSELQALATAYPSLQCHFFDRGALPLDDRASLEKAFEDIRPLICINAAAYTAVDKAESEPEQAFATNAAAVGVLAELCRAHGSLFVHVSTDYVFDGQGNVPYKETDTVHPLGVYGESKLKGEQLAMAAHDRVVILRTSWVYSYYGKNFVKTMLRLLREKDVLGVVNDQEGRPTYAADLAAAILDIAGKYARLGETERRADARYHSIYHYADRGAITWYDLTAAIREEIRSECALRPIRTEEYPTPAKRPAYSVLDTSRIEEAFGVNVPEWKDSLKRCLEKLTAGL
jgi:dTDP-4-dehydrorhamnose reductase